MKTLIKISKYSTLFALTIYPLFSWAQTTPLTDEYIHNPATRAGNNLMSLLITILQRVVMPVAAVVVVMWIIYAGFKYLTAQGKPKEIEEAHQRLLWSLIGAGILLGAAGIAEVVKNTINGFLTP